MREFLGRKKRLAFFLAHPGQEMAKAALVTARPWIFSSFGA